MNNTMSEIYSHGCLKCGEVYTDNDPDAYYCATCIEERKQIAKEIDAKMAGRSREKTPSALEIFDSQAKTMQTPNGTTASFIKIKL